ncbi:MAG: SLC13 family permease [Proteobacteria bacterium]|nr:MAG: SLC13 family permease [Pseudomonadota bacterium]
MFVAMVRGLAHPAPAILGAVVVLLVTGVIDTAQAFSGFSNPAPITVAALYVLARAIEDTGALRPLVTAALGDGTGLRTSLLRIGVPAAAASAFLNNTPIVAMLMRPVSEWAQARGVSPSRYLMPLSFAVILGGVLTTIGTSTNLVVSGLLQNAGHAPFGLFEITHVGLPMAAFGLVVVAITVPWVLPDRISPRTTLDAAGRDFVVRMIVDPHGAVAGKTVEAAGLRHLEGVFLVEIEREGEPIAPVAPTTVLHGGDHLLFVGQARLILDLRNIDGLVSAETPHLSELETPAHRFFEGVVGAASPLLGRTPKEVGFRGRYQAAIVGIHREGQPIVAKLGQVRLRVGDTLLLLADRSFRDRWRDRPDFLVISALDGEAEPAAPRGKMLLALGVTAAVVLVAGSGLLPILEASLVAALLLVATRTISARTARDSVEIDVLIVIAASFGLGAAIEQSGLAAVLGGEIVDLTSGLGWRWSLFGIVLATVVLTEFISNNAAAALMFPIAMATAREVGADPRSFAIAVAVSASASFLTPIGYQTNTMVYGPGGYRFSDYARLGAPLTVGSVLMVVLFS